MLPVRVEADLADIFLAGPDLVALAIALGKSNYLAVSNHSLSHY